MTDRFKFRVWDKTKEIMVHFDGIFYNKKPYTEGSSFPQYDSRPHYHKLSDLMQCTCLKDKSGKLIYEGDILGDIYDGLYIHYCRHCHQFQLYSQCYGCMACNGDVHWIEVAEDNKKLEVIGNIYENPELLEVEND